MSRLLMGPYIDQCSPAACQCHGCTNGGVLLTIVIALYICTLSMRAMYMYMYVTGEG